MDPVEVIARFDLEGQITPERFTWRGSNYSVVSVGRQWVDTRGWHILVMSRGERVFELIFKAEQSRWYLQDGGPSHRFA